MSHRLREALTHVAEKDVLKEAAEALMDDREHMIQDAIQTFESSTADMHKSDLEEIFRLRRPDVPTRLAALIYGVMYGVLDSRHEYGVETLKDGKHFQEHFQEHFRIILHF